MSSTTASGQHLDDLLNQLGSEIKPGETVLWKGQPVSKGLLLRNIKKLRFAVLLLILFMVLSYHESGNPAGPLSLLWFLVLGLLLVRPLKLYFGSKKWLYVITNERIVIAELHKNTVIYSYNRAEILNSNLLKKYGSDGLGDLLFRGRKTFGFVAIKDAKEVAAILDKVFYEVPTHVQH